MKTPTKIQQEKNVKNTSSFHQCNYSNNYYGDQLCLATTACNYDNNYYGDQVCMAAESLTTKEIKEKKH